MKTSQPLNIIVEQGPGKDKIFCRGDQALREPSLSNRMSLFSGNLSGVKFKG
jgi:hypothetical protein